MSTRMLRTAMVQLFAVTIIPAALVAAISTPAEAQFSAQPCTVNQAVQPVTYTCVISQQNPPKSVTLTTTLSDAEAKSALANPTGFKLPVGKRPFKVTATGAGGTAVSMTQVSIRIGGGAPIETRNINGATEFTGIELDLGGGKKVTVVVDAKNAADNIPGDGTELSADDLTVGTPAVVVPPPPPPPPPPPGDPIHDLTLSVSGIENGFAEVGTPIVLEPIFLGTGTAAPTYKWVLKGPAKSATITAAKVSYTPTKPSTVTATLTVTSGTTVLKATTAYEIVDKITWTATGKKSLAAGKPGAWSVSGIKGGKGPYRISWAVNNVERVSNTGATALTYTRAIGKVGTYKFELRVSDQGRYRLSPMTLGFDVAVKAVCAIPIQKFAMSGFVRLQVDDLDAPDECGTTTTATPRSGAGTGWYWLEFKATTGQFVDMAPDKVDNPNEPDPEKRVGRYRIAAGYKFDSDKRPQLVAPVGPGVGTLQLGFKGGTTCSWNWGSVRGPSCTISPAGGSMTNDNGVSTAYRLIRMSAGEARSVKAGLGGRSDFDAPDQV